MNSPHQCLSLLQLSSELASFEKNDSKSVRQKGGILRNNQVVKRREHKKPFPNNLKRFLQLIPGNNVCPDCSLRKNWKNLNSIEGGYGNFLSWAK